MPAYRSRTTTHGRNMAGARGLWRATGMKDGDFGKPIIAVVNSFTQFVPGHVHLKDLGQLVAREIETAGGVAKEFNTIAVDDGIAMGHDGMLYSLPSRELIADSVEYMVNAHCADAHGLHLQLRQDHARHADGGACGSTSRPSSSPAGRWKPARSCCRARTADGRPDRRHGRRRRRHASATRRSQAIERSACPTCGSCSGMFTANSMNCLTEALGLSLPGNGSMLATHADRKRLFVEAGPPDRRPRARATTSRTTRRVLPRTIASFAAFENAMTLDIAMGGSTNTVLHLLAAAHEGEVDFTMADIDRLSRRVPVLCKVAPSVANVHMEDVHRAGGIMAHPRRARPRRPDRTATCRPCTAPTLGEALRPLGRRAHQRARACATSTAPRPAACRRRSPSARTAAATSSTSTARRACIRDAEHAYSQGRRPRRALRQPRARTAAS